MNMGLIIGIVFVGVFIAVALPLVTATGSSKRTKDVQARLESAIAVEAPEVKNLAVNLRKDELLSSIPWLNKKLLQFELTPYLRRILDQANLSWSAGRLLAMSGICLVAGFLVARYRFDAFWPPLLIGIALSYLPFAFVYFKRNKRFAAFEQNLPEALDLMVSGLRAGHSLIASMGLVGRECPDPVGGEFKICFDEQNYGLELNTALDNLVERVPLQDLRIVCTAITIQKESGGNLAEVLDKTAYVIRERFRLKRQIKVHTAQGRLTGWILSLLPVVLGIAIYFINPTMMSVLWTREIGVKLLWTSAGMTVVGGLIIRKIVNMEV
jgi:tight adherence protein B